MNKYTGEQWIVPQTVALVPEIGTIRTPLGSEVDCTLRQSISTTDQLRMLVDEQPEFNAVRTEQVDFQNIPAWSRGRRNSLQGVFFGRLAVGEEMLLDVAVKPFLSGLHAGVHETSLLLYIESLGLPVYKVLGTSWTQEQGFTMITEFEEKSRSLDNVDWSKDLGTPLGEHLTNLEALRQVGVSLGMLHANGILHRDTQIKNFAVINDKVVLIDLAQSRLVAVDNYCDEIALESGVYRDLTMLTDSLKSSGFLSGASPEQWSQFFEDVICTSYRSGLYQVGTSVTERCGVDLRPIVERAISLFSAYGKITQ
jgi:tRNA A-37 threonylcarbamoyl transferase component Bud32